jgi:uncharacterized 2Fe-2S/4Fe-4S cluster protein (DUF4445 family)
VGICGSGLIDLAAALLGSGYVSSDGYMEENYVVVPSGRSATGTDIYISPKDIREIQLAKSAIASGISILLKACRTDSYRYRCLIPRRGFWKLYP